VIVVDTNVISELMRPQPARVVTQWAGSQEAAELFTTSITLAEVLYGIERLPDDRRREQLRVTALDVFVAFEDHVLSFDAPAARRYASIVSTRDRLGFPIDGFDAQIASICATRGATLATRNVKDFAHTGIALVDPWHEP